MISIKESIIGRKGISDIPILRQGDIIITRLDDIYMVLTDQDCLKKILNPNAFRNYDMSKGAYVHSAEEGYARFMRLCSFDNKLENIKGSECYDIFQVWRSSRNNLINSNDDIAQIIQIKNLKLLKKSYNLIWKR